LQPAAFDALAGDYDDHFTTSALGRLLRPRVWSTLAECFLPGQQVLEIACGTGEDAAWLAGRGVRVTATDGSGAMLRLAEAKARQLRVAESIDFQPYSLQELAERGRRELPGPYDGAFSNFGGLNTVGDWRPLAAALAGLVRPGGRVVLVPMGPFCPWEMAWYLAHGRPRPALRRFRQPASARIGDAVIPIWYPSARRLVGHFSPWFRPRRVECLGLFLPPSYLNHLLERWPALFGRLGHFEAATARFWRGLGDHYILVLERAD
jgi:SAM-dependent methyltransferase